MKNVFVVFSILLCFVQFELFSKELQKSESITNDRHIKYRFLFPGKATSEENQYTFDRSQLLAEEKATMHILDPSDPTPYKLKSIASYANFLNSAREVEVPKPDLNDLLKGIDNQQRFYPRRGKNIGQYLNSYFGSRLSRGLLLAMYSDNRVECIFELRTQLMKDMYGNYPYNDYDLRVLEFIYGDDREIRDMNIYLFRCDKRYFDITEKIAKKLTLKVLKKDGTYFPTIIPDDTSKTTISLKAFQLERYDGIISMYKELLRQEQEEAGRLENRLKEQKGKSTKTLMKKLSFTKESIKNIRNAIKEFEQEKAKFLEKYGDEEQ